MNIVLLTSSLGAGGAERVATTLSNAWAARGDQVSIIPTFSGGGSPFYELDDNVELLYLADVVGVKRRSYLSSVKRLFALRRLLKEREPDVIISFLPNVNVAAVISTAFLNIPLIICERSDPSARNYSISWRLACNLAYRFSDLLVVQTEAVANKMPDIYTGLRKVRVVPNPLPEDIVQLSHWSSSNRKVLLSLGRLSFEKQIDQIIRAFSGISEQFTNWDLYIYGDGPLKAELDKTIQDLNLQDRIFLKGRTDDPWGVMATADVFVMASRYEGFPNALLEAMGLGLACITYDCPSGPHEITRGGLDAMLVPLNDECALSKAMMKIMEDEKLRVSMGRQGRESILKRYQLSSVLDIWDEVFLEIGVGAS
jgi:glycosyltransferase involved in cell wall biosynthesis